MNSSSQFREKDDGDSFTPTLRKQLRGQLTEPSDTLNYKPFLKHFILQTILHKFMWKEIYLCYICFYLYLCRKKSLVLKTELPFTFV